jgi:Animal haem peroxidase
MNGLLFSHSAVPRVELTQNGTINLEVNVYGFDAGTPIEISGEVTQENGAIATFHSVQQMPRNSTVIGVKSIPRVGSREFVKDIPMTVVARAAEVWITTLGPDTGPEALQSRFTPVGSDPLHAAWKENSYGPAVSPSESAYPPAGTPADSTLLHHGTWWDRKRAEPLEKVMGGRFTRLFPDLPGAWFDRDHLKQLAHDMTAPAEPESTQKKGPDPEENPGIPAAYTYLGQFVDHDLTFDPTSRLREALTKAQLQALVDFRTPRFDLDNLYGRGPDDQPYMYEEDGIYMLLGEPMSGDPFDPRAVQLPRGPNGRALIGDPRNDENRIVAQLHAIFLRFHNKVADHLGGKKHVSFQEVRQQVRWHYQWVLVHDFLPTILEEHTYKRVFPDSYRHTPAIPRLRENDLELMPVEFSVAAYRFGHSMIRSQYKLNEDIERPIFSIPPDDTPDLGGFRPIPANWAIDWRFFIKLEPSDKPQLSYKIDTSLVHPLGELPPQIAKDPSCLALRNLKRGLTFQLPSGQRVAEALGMQPIANEDLMIGKATADSQQRPLTKVVPHFGSEAPLWAYILSEAQMTSWKNAGTVKDKNLKNLIPIRLGPVGGQLVADVFASLLRGDPTSYVNAESTFKPIAKFAPGGTFGLAELIKVALRPRES